MYGFKFEVEGDFAHFRDPSTQQILETFIGPPKSAVIGLIGAALGIPRGDTKELYQKLKIGIIASRIEGWRKETVNIHNLKSSGKGNGFSEKYKFKYLNNNKVAPTLRKSIVNPRYDIGLFSEDKEFLNKVRDYLKKPIYPLYLGISEYLAWIPYISDTTKCEKKKAETNEEKIFQCFTPKPNEYIPYSKEGFSIKPEVYKVPSKTYKEGKKRKTEFIDLLMQYNVDIRLMEEKEFFKIEGEKYIPI